MAHRIITPLDKEIVHKICSGQVVVTLASAIKELLENSIDAQATNIEIRLKDYGCESIEVSDNGFGIAESHFEGITKKHCTSKLRDFEDLATVTTFGFRGEALSSLCQLGDLVVHTCSADATHGTRLQFDANGCIVSRRPLARARGTTVTVSRLFRNLPVRRKHLTDPTQLAKEFAKAVNLLTAYCLVTVGVQITCTRSGKSGEKVPVISNGSATSMRDNIATVFGYTQLTSLTTLVTVESIPTDVLDEFNIKHDKDLQNIQLHGYISKPPTPQLLASSNSTSGANPRSSLLHGRSTSDRQFVYVNGRPCELPKITRLATDLWRRCSREALTTVSSGIQLPVHSTCSQFPVLILCFQVPSASVDVNLTPDKRTLLLQNERYILALTKAVLLRTLCESSGVDLLSLAQRRVDLNQSVIGVPQCSPIGTSQLSSHHVNTELRKRPTSDEQCTIPYKRAPIAVDTSASNSAELGSHSFNTLSSQSPRTISPLTEGVHDSSVESAVCFTGEIDMPTEPSKRSSTVVSEWRASIPVQFSLSELKRRWSAASQTVSLDRTTVVSDPKFSLGHFRAEDAPEAEGQLTAYFSKASFSELQVVGQFNMGFIIARHKRDLFIIDQHASDEKYRFEQLCDNQRFVSQPLVIPQSLELNVGQEQLLLSNLDVFAKSGFAFHVDESAPCGKQVHLIATPMVENKVFGRTDVEEMLFVLAESSSRRCRPSRLRDILASRACRSAVMIGTALDHGKMRRILHNMGTMEHPWNCPHGRPTIRHLFHLGRLGLIN